MNPPTILATRNLGLDIGGASIVADVSLEVAEGELLGIIGPNGAGKTSLFNLLSGLYRPTSGSITLDGRDVTDAIRTAAVAEGASRAAADPAVRSAMVAEQRRLICHGDWVAEGRDIGTVVAPHADVKVFLTAQAAERARRRAAELGVDPAEVLADLTARDERDRTREHSPLVRADDAVELDSTGLTVEQVVARIVELVRGS